MHFDAGNLSIQHLTAAIFEKYSIYSDSCQLPNQLKITHNSFRYYAIISMIYKNYMHNVEKKKRNPRNMHVHSI